VLHIELGHGIKAAEAEEVFAVRPLFRKTKKGHYIVMGPSIEGRYLTIIFELKKGGNYEYEGEERGIDRSRIL